MDLTRLLPGGPEGWTQALDGPDPPTEEWWSQGWAFSPEV